MKKEVVGWKRSGYLYLLEGSILLCCCGFAGCWTTVVSWALNGTTTLDEKIATLRTSLFAALGKNVGTSLYTFGVDGPSRDYWW